MEDGEFLIHLNRFAKMKTCFNFKRGLKCKECGEKIDEEAADLTNFFLYLGEVLEKKIPKKLLKKSRKINSYSIHNLI